VSSHEANYTTIAGDLEKLVPEGDLSSSIFLFHSPPYRTSLDRAALDGRQIDHVPVDVNVGSIAIERFIRSRQPLITLHGHVHESASITGSWRDRIGRTHLFSAAHRGTELSLVRFMPEEPDLAERELIPTGD
jgi:Icc-related predicted phosphoesterase